MPFVLDASVVGCWCFQDENDARADAAWDLLERDRDSALVPLHWWFEIRNVALHGERRGRLTEGHASHFFLILERFAIDYAPLPEHTAVLALARRHRLSFYDAVYLELAQREGMALATLDNELMKAAPLEGVRLVGPH
ncbi:MAG: type II toxin-antitoxin system VapC family toxin [Alphaproteobacteria bacterium]|nr:MAG: type II toxin-antitoxin system VapC family toxin [Alphaproteobacteria bacterium]